MLIVRKYNLLQSLVQNETLPRRPSLAAAAGGGGGGNSSGGGGGALQGLVASPLYRIWLQLGVVLLLLMLVDAGFSGDWSRIGAITSDQEAALRQVAEVVQGAAGRVQVHGCKRSLHCRAAWRLGASSGAACFARLSTLFSSGG